MSEQGNSEGSLLFWQVSYRCIDAGDSPYSSKRGCMLQAVALSSQNEVLHAAVGAFTLLAV